MSKTDSKIKDIVNKVSSEIHYQLNNCLLVPSYENILNVLEEKLVNEHQFIFTEFSNKSKNEFIEMSVDCAYLSQTFALHIFYDTAVNYFNISVYFY